MGQKRYVRVVILVKELLSREIAKGKEGELRGSLEEVRHVPYERFRESWSA